jgi:hypothetical protein
VSCSDLLRALVLLPLLVLAACGDLPRPYQGNPGATAERLALPPPPRLAVPPTYAAYLPARAIPQFSQAVAAALQAQAIPAFAGYRKSSDWRLELRAKNERGQVTPLFTLVDPDGRGKGTVEGKPVPSETWSKGEPQMLKSVAEEAAPRIEKLLAGVEAARKQSDPNSLYNRPARIALSPITGAPGDGNQALARQMREKLGKLGPVVQDSPTGTDFTLVGTVEDVAIDAKKRRIEIVWRLLDARQTEVGKIVQLNEVPAGQLDRHWGDVAVVVAEEAAGAIHDVIQTQAGRR